MSLADAQPWFIYQSTHTSLLHLLSINYGRDIVRPTEPILVSELSPSSGNYFIALKFRGIKISRFRSQAQKTAKLKCREKCILTSTAKLKCREKIVFVANREI